MEAMQLLGRRGHCRTPAIALVCVCSCVLSLISLARPAAAPAAASVLDSVLLRGMLRVGAPADYEPFAAMVPNGQVIGSDIDSARALATSLGVRLTVVRTTWSSLVDDLRAGHFDLAVGGITATMLRWRSVAFSAPYHDGVKVLVGRCGSEALATLTRLGISAANHSNVSFAVNPGGTNEQLIRARFGGARLRVVARNGEQFGVVRGGEAELTVTDDVEALIQHQKAGVGALCIGPQLAHSSQPKAFMLPRDDGPWLRYVDAFLSARTAGGEASASLDEWIAAFSSSSA